MTTTTPFITEVIKDDEAQKQKEIKRARFTKLASIFARTDSVLTSKRISVSVVDNPAHSAPAWSSTHEIWLNLPALSDDITAQSLLSAQGLNFHETAHLLYTPRNSHAVVKQVIDENLWEAFNCLEDSRIENLMVGYLPSIKSWLTATITDYLIGDKEAISRSYPLIVGRKYLPQEIQQLAVDTYIAPDDIDELADIVDEYNQIIYQGDNSINDNAINLIRRYNELLKNLPPCPNPNPNGEGEGGEVIEVVYRVKNPNGHNGRPTEGYESSSNRPASRQQQERARERFNQENGNKPRPKRKRVYVDVDTPADIPSGTPTPSDTPSDNSADTKENTNGAKENQQDNSDEVGFEAGDSYGDTAENQQVTDTLQDVMQDVVKELSKDLNQIAKQLGIDVELEGGNAKTPNRARYTEVPAPADLVLISNAFGKELERIRSNYEPAWETQVDTGRLNVNRYLNGEDFDTCFDEWQEGKSDVTAIEAVILLDKSGSMSGANADNAYKSMWAIKRALEKVEAKTSVVLFDYNTYLLYDRDETTNSMVRDSGASGGTNPCESLLFAKRVLAETDKPIKLLFMITDGAWDTKEGEQAVKDMRNAGVITCQAFLYDGQVNAEYLNEYRHSFELLTQIKSARDILTLGKDLVRLAVARNLA